ncbi:hypothetical protein [Paenibacillus sp. OV219]|uniref:hypothetical protein n=1 Tax=Paenibacillus sp. OV219 TaxID=1884377 RepID=UPI0011602FD5|nr:hypothetical protein [Paenibacillus sp. OV219]
MLNNPALVSLLKIDQQTLQADLKNGKTLVEIGQEQGVTEDQIVNAIVEQRVEVAKQQGKTDDEINQSKVQWTDQAKNQVEGKMNINRGNTRNGKGPGGKQNSGQSNNQ